MKALFSREAGGRQVGSSSGCLLQLPSDGGWSWVSSHIGPVPEMRSLMGTRAARAPQSSPSFLFSLCLAMWSLHWWPPGGRVSYLANDYPKGNLQMLHSLFKGSLGHHAAPLLLHSVHQVSCEGPPRCKRIVTDSTS